MSTYKKLKNLEYVGDNINMVHTTHTDGDKMSATHGSSSHEQLRDFESSLEVGTVKLGKVANLDREFARGALRSDRARGSLGQDPSLGPYNYIFFAPLSLNINLQEIQIWIQSLIAIVCQKERDMQDF